MRTAAPCSITARRRSSVPSTRPAANSTASSVNPSAEPSSYPQIPRTRLFCLGRVTIHPPSFPDAGDQLRLPFLQLGNLDLQPLQFAIDARQFRFRLPILQMAVPVLLN